MLTIPTCLIYHPTVLSTESRCTLSVNSRFSGKLFSRQMEKQSSRRQTTGNGIPTSPRLLRAKSKSASTSTRKQEIPPFGSNSGRKSVDRSNSTRRASISSSKGGEENRNPSRTITSIPGIIKKPQNENLVISSPVRELHRHRSPDVVKTIEKVKTKRTESVSPSAWALSPGRSSSIFPLPESLDNSGGTEKPRSRSVSSVLNYFKQKKASSVQEEAFHQLRIMHTRLLQWRFANARVESTLAATKDFAEENILKVWLRIFNLRNSVIEKRLQIQKLKNEVKITRIINPQVCILKDWEKIEKKNSEAVARIGRKLSASSTALPLINGAKADPDSVENAMLTAMGSIDGIEATISKFTSQVEETGSLASELINTVEQERKGLEELRKEFAVVASLEEQQKSLRAYVIQATMEKKVKGNQLSSSIKLMDDWHGKVKEKSIHQQRYRKGHFLRVYLSNVQNKDNL